MKRATAKASAGVALATVKKSEAAQAVAKAMTGSGWLPNSADRRLKGTAGAGKTASAFAFEGMFSATLPGGC